MKNRIAVTLLVLMAASLGSTVFAESGERSKGERHERSGGGFGATGHVSERMADRLGLDETQRQTLANIRLAAEPEMTALRERKQANRDKMKALDANDPNRSALLNEIAVENGQLATESTLLFDRVRKEASAVLTDEQRAKVEEHFGQKGKGRKGRRGGK